MVGTPASRRPRVPTWSRKPNKSNAGQAGPRVPESDATSECGPRFAVGPVSRWQDNGVIHLGQELPLGGTGLTVEHLDLRAPEANDVPDMDERAVFAQVSTSPG